MKTILENKVAEYKSQHFRQAKYTPLVYYCFFLLWYTTGLEHTAGMENEVDRHSNEVSRNCGYIVPMITEFIARIKEAPKQVGINVIRITVCCWMKRNSLKRSLTLSSGIKLCWYLTDIPMRKEHTLVFKDNTNTLLNRTCNIIIEKADYNLIFKLSVWIVNHNIAPRNIRSSIIIFTAKPFNKEIENCIHK